MVKYFWSSSTFRVWLCWTAPGLTAICIYALSHNTVFWPIRGIDVAAFLQGAPLFWDFLPSFRRPLCKGWGWYFCRLCLDRQWPHPQCHLVTEITRYHQFKTHPDFRNGEPEKMYLRSLNKWNLISLVQFTPLETLKAYLVDFIFTLNSA